MKNISCLKRISEFLKILSEMLDEEIEKLEKELRE